MKEKKEKRGRREMKKESYPGLIRHLQAIL